VTRVTVARVGDCRRPRDEPDQLGERLARLDDDGAPGVALLRTRQVDVLRLGEMREALVDELAGGAGDGHRDRAHLRDGTIDS
jgi:hypothetical protein